MRVQAAWVRIFVDGHEVPTAVLNDGLSLPDAEADKPTPDYLPDWLGQCGRKRRVTRACWTSDRVWNARSQ